METIAARDVSSADQGFHLSQNWKAILICAVLLPVCLTAVNHLSLRQVAVHSQLKSSVALAVSLIVQLAVSAWILTVTKLPSWLRTTIYVWCLSLINLQLWIMAMDSYLTYSWRSDPQMPVAALIGGEIGVLCVWAVLGRGPFIVRLPLCLIPMSGLWWVWQSNANYQSIWTNALILQVTTLAMLSALLLFFGFRFAKEETLNANSQQFGVRDLLIGTTLLAVVFAVVRITQQTASQQGGLYGFPFWIVLLGISTAVCMIAAMWASLGKDHPALRFFVFFLLAAGAGGFHWYDSEQFLTLNGFVNGQDWQRHRVSELKAWWFAWFLISPSLLLSILLYFRLSGFRLTRPR